MYKKVGYIIFILTAGTIFGLVSFYFNSWFSETMQRHQLLQIPIMIMLGFATAKFFLNKKHTDIPVTLAILIFIMSSLVFWMLPHSIDYAVINPSFNRIMHINMFLAGLLVVPALKQTALEIKIVFMGMVTAMLMATGVALKVFDLLLCSSFDIFQQKQTGLILLFIGAGFFLLTIVTFFRDAGRLIRDEKEKGVICEKSTKIILKR